MKDTARLAESPEEIDPTHDIGILIKLSEAHRAPHTTLVSERDGSVAFLPERRKRIEQIAAQVERRRKARAQPVPEMPLAAVLTFETQADGRTGAGDDDGTSSEQRAHRLASGLSSSADRIYRALVKARKWPFTIVLNGDSCSSCNMRLPSGLVGEIRRMTKLHRCPFCGRVVAETIVSC
jgi:predicted  nucleic acid-binding Zn-ribbon protein